VQPGTRLGPYEVVDLIGSGGMGEVSRAQGATRPQRASNVFRANTHSGGATLPYLLRQTHMASKLNHPRTGRYRHA
jgi:hypothetical protein